MARFCSLERENFGKRRKKMARACAWSSFQIIVMLVLNCFDRVHVKKNKNKNKRTKKKQNKT